MTDNFDIKLFYTINNDLKYRTFKIEKNTSIKNFLSLFNIHEIVDIKHFDIGVFGKVKNLDYIIKQSKKFLEGKSPPDFAPEDYEINYKGRIKLGDLSLLAKKQLALEEWN